ncbi:MAG TPA: M14 family metallopeptidase [Ohtaekwangia sp.]|nr:M14 family metallopeptidase [Ohtaekwangia sp.]
MIRTFSLLLLLVLSRYGDAQPDLRYYLPDGVTYDPAIPTPASVIGHEVGEWHVSHDRLVQYMHALDEASDRITLEVTGYTHEARPLLVLYITSPGNHARLEAIREQHLQLTDQATSAADIQKMPVVFYMGFSVHGNESSGVNAALLTAYHLAAAQGEEIEDYLAHTVVLFDPCFNPDGIQRFSTWVNSRKSKMTSPDPNDTEHHEAWPGGRFNHYWFDLNRDWLVAQHPESQARLKTFHRWKPNLLTDHHEMGTNATFFFQPGVPSRSHPLTPAKNQELTRRMGLFHAKALDELGSFYYTQETFDDFYYGKGSTFPDIQGAVGILFEQASARGHAQESVNGIVRFEFTIRNQFVTTLSSLTAANALREDLLAYQRQFFRDAAAEASKDPIRTIIFGASKDKARAFLLAQVIARQDIEMFTPNATLTVNGKTFDPGSSYLVPLNQQQYRLIKSMFEKRTRFEDSAFYDISTWTLPLAFGLDYEELKTPIAGKQIDSLKFPQGKRIGSKSDYAYVFETHGFYAPRAIYRLLHQGLRLKVASNPFYHPDGKKFERGSILIPIADQDRSANQIEYLIDEITREDGIDVHAFNTGLDYRGSSLGSNAFMALRKPEIAMVVGDGIAPTDAGEIWHLLDTRFNIPVTLITVDVFNRANLNKYNTLILSPWQGAVNFSESMKEKLKTWVQNGGVVIGLESALNWLNASGLGKFDMKKTDDSQAGSTAAVSRAYADMEAFKRAQVTSGVILEAAADLTHPLLYGYDNNRLPIFKSNNLCMEKAASAYGNPLVISNSPLVSGYISRANMNNVKNSAVAGVSALGTGRVIGFTENLCFRAFWLGTSKMLTNAIFYGPLIHPASCR